MLGPCAMIVAQGLLHIFAKQSGVVRRDFDPFED